MPDLEKLFPGRFIKAAEFGGIGKTYTITLTTVRPEKVEDIDENGVKSKTKKTTMAVAGVAGIEREWHLNRTNALCLAAMFGRDYTDWSGHKVTLVCEKDTSGLSDSGTCIRVAGSPELAEAVTVKIKMPFRGPVTRRLVPTGTTPAPIPGAGVDSPSASAPLRAICTRCDTYVPLAPDVTEADVADITCEVCGETLEVAP